jgi:hypothetical protein
VSAGFTPGPWFVAYDDSNGQAVVSGEHTEVCTCWHLSVRSIEKQMRANARLIVAAPDLYGALRDLCDEKQPAYHDCIDAGEPECVWCLARAALAKAVQS